MGCKDNGIRNSELQKYRGKKKKQINQDGVFKNIHNLFLDLKLQKQI